MKKTLIASAVAAAALSSNAVAMDQATDLAEMLEGMPEVYGNIQLAQFWSEQDPKGGPKTSSHEFADNGSTIGFKHDHAITEDLTGFFKAELEFDADDKATSNDFDGPSGLNGFDEAYIGLKGDFGSIQIGSDDTVYEQMLNITDISEAVGISGNLTTIGEGDNAQYIGSFGDFTVGLTYKIDGDSDTTRGAQIGGAYSTDAFYVGAAYSMASDKDYGNSKGQDAYGIAAEVYLGDLTLQLQYEDLDESASNASDGTDYLGLQAIYGIKATQLALGYSISGSDENSPTTDDQDAIFLQALYNVSDNMYVYVEGTQYTNLGNAKDVDGTDVAVGATYAF
jgi:predicted porin